MPYNSTYTGFEIDRAVGSVRKREKVWDNKQAKLVGKMGQIVGFDKRGNAIAQDMEPGYGGGVTARTEQITLAANGWNNNEQNIYIEGILEEEGAQLIFPIPVSSDYNAYTEAEVRVGQSLNQLKFTCTSVPVSDINVFVVIQTLEPVNSESVLN